MLKPLPSEAELEILRVLWTSGPSTVKQIHERLPRRRHVVYNTVGKLLAIMEQKGLVGCDDAARAHVFHARVDRERTRSGLVRNLAQRAFGGSAAALALHALGQARITDAEREALVELLAELDGRADSP